MGGGKRKRGDGDDGRRATKKRRIVNPPSHVGPGDDDDVLMGEGGDHDVSLSHDEESGNTLGDRTELWITAIDVGQGESTLIRYRVQRGGQWRDEQVVLVDGGRTRWVEEAILPTLDALGVREIDAMVCTHYDADHIEGLSALSARLRGGSGRVYERATKAHGGESKVTTFRNTFRERLVQIQRNERIVDAGGFSIQCVHTSTGAQWNQENDYSIALLVRFGGFSFYLGGDLTSVREDNLDLEHVCAFKCGHHGSKHSTSATFLEKITPTAAFISAGHHSYCHPDEQTLDRLGEAAVMIYATNCHYNRARLNPEFEDQEQALFEASCRQVAAWYTDNEHLRERYPLLEAFEAFPDFVEADFGKSGDFDAFFEALDDGTFPYLASAALRELEAGPHKKEERRSLNWLYACCSSLDDMHDQYGDRDPQRLSGFVSGGAETLGNIHLVVSGEEARSGCAFSVYFAQGDTMMQVSHVCGRPEGEMALDLAEALDGRLPNVQRLSHDGIVAFSLVTGASSAGDGKAGGNDEIDDFVAEINAQHALLHQMNENDLPTLGALIREERRPDSTMSTEVLERYDAYMNLVSRRDVLMEEYATVEERPDIKDPKDEILRMLRELEPKLDRDGEYDAGSGVSKGTKRRKARSRRVKKEVVYPD